MFGSQDNDYWDERQVSDMLDESREEIKNLKAFIKEACKVIKSSHEAIQENGARRASSIMGRFMNSEKFKELNG